MKNSITQQPLGITLVLFSTLIILFWFRGIFYPLPIEAAVINPMPLGAAINSWFGDYRIPEVFISLTFIYLTAIVVTRLISRNLVFPARTYVFLIFLAIIGYGMYIRSGNLPIVISVYLIAKASESFASGFRRSARPSDSFKGAILIGIAPLLYAPSVVYLLLVPVAMLVYMRGLRETIVALFAMILPMLTYSYIAWGMGAPFSQLYVNLYDYILTAGAGLLFFDISSVSGIIRICFGVLLAGGILVSIGSFIIGARTIRTRAFRIYLFMIFFLIIGLAGTFIPCASVGDLPLLALPASIVSAAYFSRYTGIMPNIFYLTIVATSIIYNISLMI